MGRFPAGRAAGGRCNDGDDGTPTIKILSPSPRNAGATTVVGRLRLRGDTGNHQP